MKALTKIILAVFFLFSAFCSLLSVANAEIPKLINYQGRLTDSSGIPLNGSYQLTFRIYDAENTGILLWEENYSGVVIQKGIFSVLLGSVTNLDLPFDKSYWLEIKVNNEVMSPRQRMASTGYAFKAETAEQAQNATTVANVGVSTTPTANKILPLGANAKIPASALKVYDSGWFGVSLNSTYTKTHNLETTKVIMISYAATDSSGSNTIIGQYYDGNGYSPTGQQLDNLTTTQVTLTTYTGMKTPNIYNSSQVTSWYARIIILALE